MLEVGWELDGSWMEVHIDPRRDDVGGWFASLQRLT